MCVGYPLLALVAIAIALAISGVALLVRGVIKRSWKIVAIGGWIFIAGIVFKVATSAFCATLW